MNKDKVDRAINHNAYKLQEQLYTNCEMNIEWQMKSIERLLKEKKKLSRLCHEMSQVDMDMEEQMTDYMDFINKKICQIINIQYEEDIMNSFRTPNGVGCYG